MRGDAKSIDVNMILYENEKMLCKITSFTDFAEDVFERLEKGINDTRRQLGANGIENQLPKSNASAGQRGANAHRSFGGGLPALPPGLMQQFGGDLQKHQSKNQDDEVTDTRG